MNAGHHPITPVVITDTANGIAAAHADGYEFPAALPVSRDMECGSHAAALAVLTIQRGLQRTPVPVRAPDEEIAERQPHGVLVPVGRRGGF